MKDYPNWICSSCGEKYGKPKGQATFHAGTCDVCGEKQYVTEPIDYGSPSFPGFIDKEIENSEVERLARAMGMTLKK